MDFIFPDFQLKNYFNEIIFCDKEISIKHRIQIFLFKYKNEFFNEIVPFNIQFKKRNSLIIQILIHMLFEYAFYNAYIDNGNPDSFFISVDSQK